MIYEVMHGDVLTASVSSGGECRITAPEFVPWNLFLEEAEDVDTRVNNLNNFYYWCSSRVLTLDRKYAKELLNSIGAVQPVTDRDRAKVALSYHCLSLTDIYWVREKGEETSFARINLYDNHLDNALVDVALRGRSLTVENAHLVAGDLSTSGVFPKAWVRRPDGFWLYKDGDADAVEDELLASRAACCIDCPQVRYEPAEFEGVQVSASRLMTNPDYSIATREAFEIYAANHEIDAEQFILQLDPVGFHRMNIIDYLIGNTDRHWGNWGFLVDNQTGRPVRLHDLMDFNQSFRAYDTPDGGRCQTYVSRRISQREAAEEGVRAVGLGQVGEISRRWFGHREEEYRMLKERLDRLKAV